MQLDNTKQLSEIEKYLNRYDYELIPSAVKDAFETEMLMRLSWNTNHLEGNTLTLDETIDVIEYDEVRSGHTYSEYREAKAAYRANRRLLNFRAGTVIDLDYIQQANALFTETAGEFRTGKVYIGTLAENAYTPPAPENIPALMQDYTRRLKLYQEQNTAQRGSKNSGDLERIIGGAARIHMDFERIHPFRDGNGRTGRLFLNQFLLNMGLLPVIIENNSRYRQAFRICDRSGDTALMEYCIAAGILKSGEVLKANCEKLM